MLRKKCHRVIIESVKSRVIVKLSKKDALS